MTGDVYQSANVPGLSASMIDTPPIPAHVAFSSLAHACYDMVLCIIVVTHRLVQREGDSTMAIRPIIDAYSANIDGGCSYPFSTFIMMQGTHIDSMHI